MSKTLSVAGVVCTKRECAEACGTVVNVTDRQCYCGSTIAAGAKTYGNFVTHVLNDKHALMTVADKVKAYQLGVPQKVIDYHAWLSVIIMENRPFNDVQSEFMRTLANRENTMSVITLMKLLEKLFNHCVAKLTIELKGKKMGLYFDGWSQDGVHYIAVIASYCIGNSTLRTLLCISPLAPSDLLPNEAPLNANHKMFGADVMKKYLEITMEMYGLTRNEVDFIGGDNCSTNCATVDAIRIPFIGCACHRLNRAVQEVFNIPGIKEAIASVTELMSALSSDKNRTVLTSLQKVEQPLGPLKPCATRWTGTIRMLIRFDKLYGVIRDAIRDKMFTDSVVLPSAVHTETITALLPFLLLLFHVNKLLQAESCTFLEMRSMFDHMILEYGAAYPVLEQYISPTAPIVHHKDFENGVLKLQKREPVFDSLEAAAVKRFLNDPSTFVAPPEDLEPNENDGAIERLKKRVKREKLAAESAATSRAAY